MDRVLISSNTQWETTVGYSRAVRVGSHIYVAGTTGIDEEGKVVGDARAQTLRALDIIQKALAQAGAQLADVVRTRLFVTDMDQWDAIGNAHGEVFREIRPASTVVEVKRLIRPDLIVEIEADAVIGDAR
jgi:enamine deaminase RidA (YjgF/YER057c/UK114 family)